MKGRLNFFLCFVFENETILREEETRTRSATSCAIRVFFFYNHPMTPSLFNRSFRYFRLDVTDLAARYPIA